MSRIRADRYTNRLGTGAPTFSNGVNIIGNVGVGTTVPTSNLTVKGDMNVTGTVSVGGTLTYEDVTSIDSVGIITAQSGIHVTGGSVGIGTNNPTASLQINSATPKVILRDDDNTADISVASIGGAAVYSAASDIIFQTVNTSEKVRITSAGNFGIGTNAPGALLSLESTAANAAKIRLGFDGPRYYDIFRGSTTNSGYLNFYGSQTGFVGYVFDGVDGERMRIDTSGRVLIGTTSDVSPAGFNNRIQVNTNSYTASILLRRDSNNDGAGNVVFAKSRSSSLGGHTIVQSDDDLGKIIFYGADGTDTNTPAASIEAAVDGTPGANDMPGRLMFKTTSDGAASASERMRIDKKGRVNIGDYFTEDYANTRLWVNGYDNLIISEGNSTGWTEGAFKCVAPVNSRGGGIFMFNSNNGGTTNQWFAGRPYSNSDQYIIARSTGMNVATQSTAQTSNQLFSVYSSGNATLQGTLSESGSDDKLKKNRTPLTSALEKVKTLEGFTYNWNDDAINNYGFPSDEGTLVGMSAQDLQSVLPEAVKTVSHDKEVSDPTSGDAGEKQEYLTIQYGRVVPLLVEAIKELSAKVAALEGS